MCSNLPVCGRGTRRGKPEHDPAFGVLPVSKLGFTGKTISILANYFAVKVTPHSSLFEYKVIFDPEPEVAVRKTLLRENRDLFLNGQFQFDGSTLWTPVRLRQQVTNVSLQSRVDGNVYQISIKMIGEINRMDPVMLQICNIQLKKNLSRMNMKSMGRNFYNPDAAVSVEKHKLELWPGYVTSIRQHEAAPLLCVDLTFKIVRTDTVLQFLEDLYQADKTNFQQAAVKKVIGSIVLTRYNNRTYRIDDIDWEGSPKGTFLQADREVTYVSYYQQRWGLKIGDESQPLLISRPKARDIRRGQFQNLVLIPELCTMTGLDDATRANVSVMRDVAAQTRVEPGIRVKMLHSFRKRLNDNEEIKAEMEQWGMEYSNELVELHGRLLVPEKIHLPDLTVPNERRANWISSVRGTSLVSSVTITKWLLIFPEAQVSLAKDFVRSFLQLTVPMHIKVAQPQRYSLNDDRTATYVQTLQQAIDPSVQLVVVIVTNNRKDRYDAIKRLCYLDFPVASQVVVARTISSPERLMSIVTNIALQINCKLGGELWSVEIPLKNLMVCGYDTYHDSSKRSRSVGALVCSTNSRLTQYYSRSAFHTNHQELTNSMVTTFTALKVYHEKHTCLPQRIVFFRDGVGDGQLSAVTQWEVAQLKDCFKAVQPEYSPKFAFLIVNKRLNTRLFAKEGSRFINPCPGTVVDDIVTRPERYDFFLVSQSVRQGTVSPTQYNVIHDTSGLKPDHLQRLTYKLTHLYYNWPGTISVPAPCQYAHKLALLVGDSLQKDPHLDLAETLFYL